jgi:hypothetical protein
MTQAQLAQSTGLTEKDKENRALAMEVIKKSNDVVTSFAKQMVTTSLSANGVILALAKFRGFADHGERWARIALASAGAACLAAALVFALASRARRIRVSLDDYANTPYQLLDAARCRERITSWGLALLAAAIFGATLVLTLV